MEPQQTYVIIVLALLQNLQLVENLEALAAKKGCTVGQLALAWVRLAKLLSGSRTTAACSALCSTLNTLQSPGLRRCWQGAKM